MNALRLEWTPFGLRYVPIVAASEGFGSGWLRRIVWVAVLFVMTISARDASSQDMVFPGEQWTRTTPELQRVDSARLEKAVQFLKANTPRSTGVSQLAIIRNGRMIWEGANVDRAHEVFSVTKSFTSSILGLLIDDGVLSRDTPASNYFPELAEKYADVTLQHLVNMTSPWRAVGENSGRIPSLSDTLWSPDEPLFQPAGAESYYSNANYEVLSRILTRATGQRLDDFFGERIGERIGMTNWTWTDWDGSVNAAPDGIVVNRGSHGLNVSAQEAARYGHLFLNEGRWNDQQLISAQWVH